MDMSRKTSGKGIVEQRECSPKSFNPDPYSPKPLNPKPGFSSVGATFKRDSRSKKTSNLDEKTLTNLFKSRIIKS